ERMLADGLQADEVSSSSVIKACVHKGELDLAGYWLERMAAAGLTGNEVAGACLQAGDEELLIRWRALMKLESRVVPNKEISRPSPPSTCTAHFEDPPPDPSLAGTCGGETRGENSSWRASCF
ncbi:unnamed protein product, partial [Polarella glacialis]